MMSPTTANINSLAEGVTAIRSLQLRAARGENIEDEIVRVALTLNELECTCPEDAIALLNLSRMVLDHLVHAHRPDSADPQAGLAATSWLYLDRSINYLETLMRQADIQNGATIN